MCMHMLTLRALAVSPGDLPLRVDPLVTTRGDMELLALLIRPAAAEDLELRFC